MIGILGGTFDPVHYGHLRTALEVQQQLPLEELRFLPAAVPPHRPQPLASAAQRQAMVTLALEGQPGMAVDDRELRRQGPSYMVDTLASLRAELGDTPLVLILGMDAFHFLPSWYQSERITELAHVVVMTRPGSKPPQEGALGQWVDRHRATARGDLGRQAAGLLAYLAVSQLDISASTIRKQLAAGVSPRFLLPDAVLDYIHREGLYGVTDAREQGYKVHAT